MTAKPDWPPYLEGNITRWVQAIGIEGPNNVISEILLTCIDAIRAEREACAEIALNHCCAPGDADIQHIEIATAIRARGLVP